MDTLNELKQLKNGATLFGKFHPKDYLVAIFDNPKSCDLAIHALEGLEFAKDDVVAVDGALLLAHQDEIKLNRTFIDRFCAMFADRDTFVKSAEKVAQHSDYRFLMVYCPTQEQTAKAVDAICTHAVLAQKYEALTFYEIVVGQAAGSHCRVPDYANTLRMAE